MNQSRIMLMNTNLKSSSLMQPFSYRTRQGGKHRKTVYPRQLQFFLYKYEPIVDPEWVERYEKEKEKEKLQASQW